MLAIIPKRIKEVVKVVERSSNSFLSITGLLMMIIGIFFLSIIEI